MGGRSHHVRSRRASTFTAASFALSTIVSVATPACFFYDSRWGETKRTQKSVARHTAPATLAPTPAERSRPDAAPPQAARRKLKVRAHATPRYASEVIDWPRRLAENVDDANRVLAPTLGVELEVVAAEPWAPRASDDDLAVLAEELVAADSGEGVDRVVGLAGSVPRYELSFHQLGLARVSGKHLVVRTMNDAREYEAVQRTFSELEESERSAQYRMRKRHKTTSVLLHEIGHTLGVPHEVDGHTIMHASYSPETQSFSAAAATLMRLTLAHELEPAEHPDPAYSQALVAQLESTSESWLPADRDAMLARLRAKASAPPRPAASSSPKPRGSAAPRRAFGSHDPPVAAPEPRLGVLSSAELATYERARAAQKAGHLDDAWATAEPLFAAHPDVEAVQDLRCQLAMARRLPWNEVQAECAIFMKMVGARPAKP